MPNLPVIAKSLKLKTNFSRTTATVRPGPPRTQPAREQNTQTFRLPTEEEQAQD